MAGTTLIEPEVPAAEAELRGNESAAERDVLLDWQFCGLCESALRKHLEERPDQKKQYKHLFDWTGALKWEHREKAPELCAEVGIDVRPMVSEVYGPFLEANPDARIYIRLGPVLDSILAFESFGSAAPVTAPAKRPATQLRGRARRGRSPPKAKDDRPRPQARKCARPACGDEFIPSRRDQECCSSKCASANRVARFRARQGVAAETATKSCDDLRAWWLERFSRSEIADMAAAIVDCLDTGAAA